MQLAQKSPSRGNAVQVIKPMGDSQQRKEPQKSVFRGLAFNIITNSMFTYDYEKNDRGKSGSLSGR